MKRRLRVLIVLAGAIVMVLALGVGTASADPDLGPCNGSPATGQNYAKNHILIHVDHSSIGNTHRPGTHMGFSACLGVHS